MQHIRVKAHAYWREHPVLLLLLLCEILPISIEQDSSGRFYLYVFMFFVSP
jgi:hypothetical protein